MHLPDMKSNNIKTLGMKLSFFYLFYALLSYLILLRDEFLLERISVLTNTPLILEKGRILAKVLRVNSIPTLFLFIIIFVLFYFYAKTLRRLTHETDARETKRVIVTFSLIFMAISIFSFPSLSTDVFDYVASNRVLFVHNSNPWLHAPVEFPTDEFIYLGSWKFRASVYGPVQFVFSSLVHTIAQDNLIGNIIGFKIMNAAFFLASITIIKKWLEKYSSDSVVFGLAIFAWNPLVHIEILGNAHNDIIMGFFSLLCMYFLFEKKVIKGAIALSLAILAKVTAVIFIPVIAIWMFQKQKNSSLMSFLSATVSTTLIGFLSLGDGLGGFIDNLGVQLGLYLRSLPTIIRFTFLSLGSSMNQAQWAEKLFTIPPYLYLYAFLVRKVRNIGILEVLVSAMLIYLLLVSPMLQPWYLVWILPLVALLRQSRVQIAAVTMSFSSLLHYVVLFTSYYFSPLNFIWQIIMFLTIAIPPLIVWFIPKSWYTQLVRRINPYL